MHTTDTTTQTQHTLCNTTCMQHVQTTRHHTCAYNNRQTRHTQGHKHLLVILSQLEAGCLYLSLRDVLHYVPGRDGLAGPCLGPRGDGLLQHCSSQSAQLNKEIEHLHLNCPHSHCGSFVALHPSLPLPASSSSFLPSPLPLPLLPSPLLLSLPPFSAQKALNSFPDSTVNSL